MISKTSLQFLEDLKENNYRDWFQANQKRYDEYKKDYRQMVDAFIAEMSKEDETLSQLEFKDCSFRINKDIRFSKDKSPYKTNMGIWMSAGTKNTNLAGYYVHIEKGASFIAAGVHWPDAADLKKIRSEIAGFYEDLEDIVDAPEFKKLFGSLDSDENNTLKTSPKDYAKDHPAIAFLKLKSFTATAKLSDKEIENKDFVANTSKKLSVLKPFVEFLNRGLTTE
ncbi:DUF2461 domain-containing protein [Flavobacterium sp. DG1-102-2]|uniref:DUF2461 domain-containing protein n=1 Tax=Flavobacterium sp. DG1-102-2 TaxID=3081663 RepID=UPI00294A7617|nr:DUF2461 domain-containing protein [Flavobacterium sp. DG1-102-2]MDV6169873.1 DUF2461 domain-containing protein [Flavobacterium sp. DG1-102-2]